MPAASQDNIQFHMVSYCSAIKLYFRIINIMYHLLHAIFDLQYQDTQQHTSWGYIFYVHGIFQS